MFVGFNPQQQQLGFPGMGMSPMMGMGMSPMGMSPFGAMGQNPMGGLMQMLQGLMMGMLLGQLLQMAMQGGIGGQGGGGFNPAVNPGFGGGGCGCRGGNPAYRMGNNGNQFTGGANGANGTGGLQNAGPAPPAGPTGNARADYAKQWANQSFKPGQKYRCADFVSTMLERSGTAPPGFRHTALAADFAKYGQQVGRNQLQAGDIVLFGNTYRPGKYTHVGIYLGNGQFVHRPTSDKPVRIDRMDTGYYAQKFTEGRRM